MTTARRAGRYAVLVFLALAFLVPLVWMILTSLKTYGGAQRIPPDWLPNPFSGYGYERILNNAESPVLRWFLNSMLAATLHTLLSLATASAGELEEAAVLDGANHWQIFTRVLLPLSQPALATLAVLSFLTNWNDFLWPVYVLFSPEQLTLPPGLGLLQRAYNTDYPVVMAGAVLASVPVLLLFVLAQRHIIQGVSRSGLKG
ncbi:carbohydrate ABC transporter permease [Micromonospora olivasterospora]|uniref:Binding-protein-dependent transport system inner membrane component n=1 Tax=Micromonospora olivasterospora TaxID=1880 RepID=A0A562I7T8_MICOL|nr:carbohydrate ABC transporter permease [Micromonospora olivasterospora]TWH66734.1 binding-protein-dependent transport system inner membrane component [Micromonospora olivasterospora]